MMKTFSPKYVSRYNSISGITIPRDKISVEAGRTEFVAKNVKVEKRVALQSSYAKRSEREKLRAYNG